MSKVITYWTQTPAIDSLSIIYGDRWEAMPIHERTAIMTAISAAINASVVEGESLPLNRMVEELMGDIEWSDSRLLPLLAQLDKELDNLQEPLYLVAGIALSTPLDELEKAAA